MSEHSSDPTPPGTAPSAPADETLMHSLRSAAGRVVFERFHLVRELGAGGMAVVWLARDERLGMEVALKFLPGMVASDPEALHDLRREITRGLRITHPGIVRVYDLHEDAGEGLAAIAMEYIDGATLAEAKGRQPERCFEAAEPLTTWMRTLCDALIYVHEKARVVHRDLKPRNLMVTAEGDLKVTDFGIAATLCDSHSRVTQNPGSSGTPVYMSPQQAAGQNPRAADDIYALGATIYELLTSKPPFFRGAMPIILNQVATSIPPSMHERREELGVTGRAPIPPQWEQTVALCLSKDPEDRPASVREVAARLGLRDDAPLAAMAAGAHGLDDEEMTMTGGTIAAESKSSAHAVPPPLPPPTSPPRLTIPPPLEQAARSASAVEEPKVATASAAAASKARAETVPRTATQQRPLSPPPDLPPPIRRPKLNVVGWAIVALFLLGVIAAGGIGWTLIKHPESLGLGGSDSTAGGSGPDLSQPVSNMPMPPLPAIPTPPPLPPLPSNPTWPNAWPGLGAGQAWPGQAAQQYGANDNVLKEIECEVSRAFVEQKIGLPQHFSSTVQQQISKLGLNLQYCRYESPIYEMQILYSAKGTVTAFTVRVDHSYYQKFRPDQSSMYWTLGKSTLADIDQMAGPTRRPSWVTGGQNYVSYIEKYYFGRPGQFCDYYFCCTAPFGISTPQAAAFTKISRTQLLPYAVLVAEQPKNGMTASQTQAWESFLVQLVAAPGRVFEQ